MSCRDRNPQLGKLQPPERNHYYYGKLLGEREFEQEQDYFNYKRWLLNRLGLGAGILCGLDVTPSKDGKQLCISPGVAVDALGREIIVPETWCFDPWLITDRCGHVKETLPRDEKREITICLAYHECYADYAPVLVTDCNIREQCAPGTVRESFTVIISEGLPKEVGGDSEICDALAKGRQQLCEVTSGACASPSEETFVILAGVALNKNGIITINDIKTCEYRTTLYSNERLFEMILCLAGHGGSGATGPKGDPGSKWYTGSTDPAPATPVNSVDGDCYLNTVTGDVFEKTGGAWNNKGNIKGPRGPAGPGLNPDLPKILDIAWEHDKNLEFTKFMTAFQNVCLPDGSVNEKLIKERIINGDNIPPFTIYFNRKLEGLSRKTFQLRIKAPFVFPYKNKQPPIGFPGINLDFDIYGEVITIDGIPAAARTPHTNEGYEFAATFIPCREFMSGPFVLLVALVWFCKQYRELEWPTFNVDLKGDFLWSPMKNGSFDESGVLDADNIGGRVGMAVSRGGNIQGGINPSGNLTQGGDFESWLMIEMKKEPPKDAGDFTNMTRLSSVVRPTGFDYSAMPVSINFADEAQLTGAGFTSIQAKAIIAGRSDELFSGTEDFKQRAKINSRLFNKIQSGFIFF